MKEKKSREQIYWECFDTLFSDTNAQTSIRTRIINEFKALDNDEMLTATYVPRSGKDKGKTVEHLYISPTIRRVIWLKDTALKRGKFLFKREKIGTYWSGFPLNNLTKEGDVQFPKGKKPEALLEKVIELATNTGDLILDSFLGSGTTAAVAHKMGRRYIGIEMGEQAKTHCAVRLKKVIDGEQGGISEAIDWQGGGGFRFYTLGDTIFDENGQIRDTIKFDHLAAHIWFYETQTPLNKPKTKSAALGIHNGVAYALLYNGILHDQRIDGGNVLTSKTFEIIRKGFGKASYDKMVIYGEASRIGSAKLKELGIEFKQTPYDVRVK